MFTKYLRMNGVSLGGWWFKEAVGTTINNAEEKNH